MAFICLLLGDAKQKQLDTHNNMLEQGVIDRRREELEALQSFYGNDFLTDDENEMKDDNNNTIPLEGPWFILIQQADINDTTNDGGSKNNKSSIGIPTLEIQLPKSYPLGEECPTPRLHHIMMKPQLKEQLLNELKDMYEQEMDVGIMWCERCREELLDIVCDDESGTNTLDGKIIGDSGSGNVTFIPPTTKYHQPIRNFPKEVCNNTKYRRDIIHTQAFHPPKSGPGETLIAHACTVTCMEHVQWALADLLFNDKKVAKATHNMFAYRFTDENGILVSDNDDDGEKGSGNKLASLLDLTNVDNVLVVVSRWFGGIHLGPARFKWIAAVARDGLVQGGYLER